MTDDRLAECTNRTVITFFGQPMGVGCDGRRDLAVGINWCNDDGEIDELEIRRAGKTLAQVRADPDSWEGEDAKPRSDKEFPNKWCVRQCEQCVAVDMIGGN